MTLDKRSKEIRLKAYKLSKANGGYHYGGTFSCAEILLALYDHILTENDIFILSKGHGCWIYYSLLIEKGLNPKLDGHPYRDISNGIHWTTGSEGHGMPVGVGIALAKKIQGKLGNVYVLVGDGECQEGTFWESLLLARQHNLDNLIVIVDNNKIQGSGFTNHILRIDKIIDSVSNMCGWRTSSISGHDMQMLIDTISKTSNLPKLIIANTIKGKGVSFMENDSKWHANWVDTEHEKILLEELS